MIPLEEAGTWIFTRQNGDIIYGVRFQAQTFSFPQGKEYTLRTSFVTNAPGTGLPKDLTYLIEDVPIEARSDMKFYKTEQQVEEYLVSAVKVTVESAIPLFDCLIRPDINPTKQLDEELSVDPERRAEDFMRQHHLSFADSVAGIKEMIQKTESVIKAVQFAPLEEVTELLINATAYVGELIRKVHGGEWGWDTHYGNAYILNDVGGYKSCQSGALGITFSYWVRPEIYGSSIRASYKELLHKLGIEDYFES